MGGEEPYKLSEGRVVRGMARPHIAIADLGGSKNYRGVFANTATTSKILHVKP